MRQLIIILVSLLLSACVAFPIHRTYFEPNKSDGQLSRSSGDGFHRTKYDGLSRKVADIEVGVYPYYMPGQPMRATISIGSQEAGEVDLQASRIELVNTSNDKVYTAEKIERTALDASKYNPYHYLVYNLTFPVRVDDLAEIRIDFPKDSLTRDRAPLEIAPFRFSKVTKWDFFLGTVN